MELMGHDQVNQYIHQMSSRRRERERGRRVI